MKKDPKVFLGHIFECIELIEAYIKHQTFDAFKKINTTSRFTD
jgi:uncharacterized protein with HEPN domain